MANAHIKLEKTLDLLDSKEMVIPKKFPFPRLATDLLVSNACIYLRIVKY